MVLIIIIVSIIIILLLRDIIMRPFYTSCLSVCLSVCPMWARNSKTRNVEKSKSLLNIPRAWVSAAPIFS